MDKYGRSKGRQRHAAYAVAKRLIWRKYKHPRVLMLAGESPQYERAAIDATYNSHVGYTPVVVDQQARRVETARRVYRDQGHFLVGKLEAVHSELSELAPFHIANMDFCGTFGRHEADIARVGSLVAPGGVMMVWLCQRDSQVREYRPGQDFGVWYDAHADLLPSNVSVHTAMITCRVHETLGIFDWQLRQSMTYRGLGTPMAVSVFQREVNK